MIRPELKVEVRRWREALAGGAVLVLGLWLVLTSWGLLAWLGVALCLGGAALALAGWQRGRFRTGGGGPGIVTVDEGRLTYYGPLTGGSIAVRDLVRLSLDPSGHPAHWVLESRDETVHVPLTAEGTDALFDVLARLPRLDMGQLLAAMRQPPETRRVLWQAPPTDGVARLDSARGSRPSGSPPH